MTTNYRHNLLLATLVIIVLSFGCSKNSETPRPSSTSNSNVAQATPASSPLTDFERDLRLVRNGQFTYIWVFSRKDGKPLDKEDGAALRRHASHVVDFFMTENGTKAIGGANFNIEADAMSELQKRFVVEDYSAK